MSPPELITSASLQHLCALASLPLTEERRARLAPMLSSLVTAANELNRKMADARYRMIVPIARFPER